MSMRSWLVLVVLQLFWLSSAHAELRSTPAPHSSTQRIAPPPTSAAVPEQESHGVPVVTGEPVKPPIAQPAAVKPGTIVSAPVLATPPPAAPQEQQHGLIAVQGGPGSVCGLWDLGFLSWEKPALNKPLRLSIGQNNANKNLVGQTMYYSAACEEKPSGVPCPARDYWLTLKYPQSGSAQYIGNQIIKWGRYRIRLTYNPATSKSAAANGGVPFLDLTSCAAKDLVIEFTVPEPP